MGQCLESVERNGTLNKFLNTAPIRMEDTYYEYKGIRYCIEDLRSQPKESLSGRQKMALKSYGKKSQAATCKGFFGVPCTNPIRVSAMCSSCYHKNNYLKGVNLFLSEVLNIQDMDVSTCNLLNFSGIKCVTCGSKGTVSYPFCGDCLSKDYGLAIKPSFIPGAGLGLFSTRDFRSGESLGLEYTGKVLSEEQYWIVAHAARYDSKDARKLDYMMETPDNGSYIDASDESGGPLRYINQSPSFELKNSKWCIVEGRVSVKTIKVVRARCEFYLDYSQETSENAQFSSPSQLTIDALEQLQSVCEHFITQSVNWEKKKKTWINAITSF